VHLTHVKVSRVLRPGYEVSVDDSGPLEEIADLLAGRVTRDASRRALHVTPQGTAALRDCIRAGFVETLPPDR
jgi:hypothetical protein